MENKTEEQKIIEYLNKVIYTGINKKAKCRKRVYVDPRNYLMGLLYHKYHYIEEELASIFKKDRCTINHSKHLAYYNRMDSTFIENTTEVRKLFPYTFTAPEKKVRQLKQFSIKMYINENDLEKLKCNSSKI